MNKKRIIGTFITVTVLVSAALLAVNHYKASTHEAKKSPLGMASNMQNINAMLSKPVGQGIVSLTTVVAADWQVPLAGLVNLNHDKSQQAQLKDKMEPIKIFTYVLEHPTHGSFLIDTGVSEAFVHQPETFGVNPILHRLFGLEHIDAKRFTADIIGALSSPLRGVFLTHLHVDHISGLPEVSKQVPIYTGQGEAAGEYWINLATQKVVDTLLSGRPALREWKHDIVDVFGDSSMFALHMPGHTPGSTAYLINTTGGPVLLAGDISHTTWGWNNSVEPGDFTQDKLENRASLLKLKALVKAYPSIKVKLGHQSLPSPNGATNL